MRKITVTTGALITQGAAESTPCEVLPFPESQRSGCEARNGHGRSAQSSCLVSETLTARERDILAMIGQGLSNKRIARAREISPETVKSHVKHIFSKLAVSSRAQAVSQAASIGLLRGGNPRQEEGRRSAVAVSRSNFLPVAAILWSPIVAIGYAGPVSADPLSLGLGSPATVSSPSPERTLLAQASSEDAMARCQHLSGLYDRHNSDGYAPGRQNGAGRLPER
jgi:DNA-binding CsgD family transcriptional regulator